MIKVIIVAIIVILLVWIFFGRKDVEFKGLTLNKEDLRALDTDIDIPYENIEEDEEDIGEDSADYDDSDLEDNITYIEETSEQQIDEMKRLISWTKENLQHTEENRTMHPWKGERLLARILTTIYGKPFVKARPSFLINPETGYRLELDCYNEELKIAAEFNGPTHYCYPNYTGCSLQEFKDQVRRDYYKREICKERGIYLMVVPHTIRESEMIEHVVSLLPEFQSHLD